MAAAVRWPFAWRVLEWFNAFVDRVMQETASVQWVVCQDQEERRLDLWLLPMEIRESLYPLARLDRVKMVELVFQWQLHSCATALQDSPVTCVKLKSTPVSAILVKMEELA